MKVNLALFFALALGLASCKSAPPAPYPHQSVLAVVSELKIFLRLDPYSAEPGRDLEGHNIFRVSLARLENVESILGDEYADILAFARAECHERLGQWPEAAAAFAEAAGRQTLLTDEAKIREQWARKIADVTAEPETLDSLDAYLNHLDAVRLELAQLRDSKPAFPYDAFLALEMERALERKTVFVFANRFVIERGAETALELAQKLVEENAESRRVGEHLLLLGSIHESRARDYVQFNDPTRAEFDVATWVGWVEQARLAYTRAAQSDGDPAKPEGQARLRALDAFAQRTIDRAN